tara:strand:+ start:6977 stop:7999 length:1023 start_codon:yes stop_codon:yes gene_type:complete
MLKPENILNSYNFARQSNVVFSEILTKNQFKNLNIQNYEIVNETETLIFYKLTKFALKENDIIFCNTDMLKNLFNILKRVDNLKNIKLITNQTDTLIDKKLYNLKPKCIGFWYSINVGIEKEDLIPIPLGLSNDYSPKNILINDIKFSGINKDSKSMMYLNFSENTNFKERNGIYKKYKEKSWSMIDSPLLSISDYQNSLEKYRFIMCPWGNGIDTHRIWETLYSGNIPITKKHHTFSTSTELPILFIDEYDDIDINILEEFFDTKKDDKNMYSKLDIKYWIAEIKKIELTSEEAIALKEKKIISKISIFKHKTKSKALSRLKKIKYYLRKIKKIRKILK